jgi:hypothetical protein
MQRAPAAHRTALGEETNRPQGCAAAHVDERIISCVGAVLFLNWI